MKKIVFAFATLALAVASAANRYNVIYKSPQAGLGYADVTYADPRTFGGNFRYSF